MAMGGRETQVQNARGDGAKDVTALLRAWSAGDRGAEAEVLPLIYQELRRIAHGALNGDVGSTTLHATDIVNEAYLRLSKQHAMEWHDRQHFFAITATVVRRILLDAARRRLADKRDKRLEVIALDEEPAAPLPAQAMSHTRAAELVDLDAALSSLSDLYPRQARLVELRYFSGLSLEETARYLNVSIATAKRDWTLARVAAPTPVRCSPRE